MKFIEDDECHFVPNLKCKWPQEEESLKANINEGGPDDVHSLRPFEYTGTCTNCLLSMILSALTNKEATENDSDEKR